MVTIRTAVLTLGAIAVVGCSGSSTGSSGSTSGSGTSGSGSTGSTGSGSTTGGAAALCNNPPANTAPQISDSYSSSPMPASGTAQGGTIPSGTFYMTAITNYGQASGSGTHKNTLVFDANAMTFVDVEVNGGTTKPTVAASYAVSGHVLTENVACPTAGTATVEFTADSAGTLTFYNYSANSVSTFTKQ